MLKLQINNMKTYTEVATIKNQYIKNIKSIIVSDCLQLLKYNW